MPFKSIVSHVSRKNIKKFTVFKRPTSNKKFMLLQLTQQNLDHIE